MTSAADRRPAIKLGPPRSPGAGSLRLKIVVARQGTLLSHESNVVLMTNEHAASVEQIVRDAAAKLAQQ